MTSTARSGSPLTAIVPTLGLSPLLGRCLEALRADAGERLRLVIVHQGTHPLPLATGQRDLIDALVRLERNLGFAGGVNAGLERALHADPDLGSSPGGYVALVNDDVVVEHGWSEALIEALEQRPAAAAAQGVNLVADTALGSPPSGHLVDGQGIALNRWLQAIQLGHRQLESTLARSDSPVEILGVSGTAAVFRTDALRRLSCPTGVLDERLQSYYEDFDLACRLRALGYTAWLAPEARAKHRPSTTASREPRSKEALIYGNRWLVLAKVLGRAFPAAIPRALARDLLDLAHAALSRSGPSAAGLLGGWARAARRLPAFVSFDAPMLDRRTRGRFTVGAQAPHAASGGPS